HGGAWRVGRAEFPVGLVLVRGEPDAVSLVAAHVAAGQRGRRRVALAGAAPHPFGVRAGAHRPVHSPDARAGRAATLPRASLPAGDLELGPATRSGSGGRVASRTGGWSLRAECCIS